MFKTTPTYYQEEIYERSRDMPYAALFLEQGLGKSKIEIDTSCRLFLDGALDGVVVVSNKAVAENWYINEIPKHIWADVHSITRLWGRTNRSEQELIQFINLKGIMKWYCINIEALRNAKCQSLVSRLLDSGRFKLIIDESTIIKNPSAAQSRRCLSLGKKATYTRILSGEPAPNGAIDLYHQYKFLSPNALPGYTKDMFEVSLCKAEYSFISGGARVRLPAKEFTDAGQKLFEQMVGPFTFRLRKADVNDSVKFPAIHNLILKVQMTPKQRDLYNLVLSQVKTEVSDAIGGSGTIRADVIISKLIKLHQITSGFCILEDGSLLRLEENPKLTTMINLIYTSLESHLFPGKVEPVIIWCHYRADVDAVTAKLQAHFPGQVARIYGGIQDGERLTSLERFYSGQVPILVANPQSIGHGLTLTAADTAIYFSNHYNYEYRVQSRDRIHRLGQKSDTCHYIDLVMEDSIDEQIIACLENKAGFCNQLFKSEWIQKVLGLPAVQIIGKEPDMEEAA